MVPNRGAGLVSDDIDRALTGADMRFTVAEQPYRLPHRLWATAPYVLPRSTRHRMVFNGLVVGLRGDPLPPETISRALPACRTRCVVGWSRGAKPEFFGLTTLSVAASDLRLGG